jgi:hypothetical protein
MLANDTTRHSSTLRIPHVTIILSRMLSHIHYRCNQHSHSHAQVTVTRPKSWSAILSNMAGLTSMSVGWHPVPAAVSIAFSHTSNRDQREEIRTSINHSHVDAHLLARPLVDPLRSDLAATQRVLVGVAARLRSIERVVRDGHNRRPVVRVNATGAEPRAVVGQVASPCFGIGWER